MPDAVARSPGDSHAPSTLGTAATLDGLVATVDDTLGEATATLDGLDCAPRPGPVSRGH
ncbi:hypothetical protein GCM10010103_55230 [Streptomyces paradoxus]|uniref:Uncharacterized protein n=1 Tax=Streptomyces paradoxus TaxID=66375 RepID=A0A7W9TEY1_9ACTN|nr:hypothetical protein [Streptomyces paradoxus]MBB6079465.1 hypothetical protein [Streptomyces paradoxus]